MKPRIKTITVGRLYNLGNYEHVRYELSVEVPEGSSAARAFNGIVGILAAINPKPPLTEPQVKHAEAVLSEPQAWDKNIANKKERQRSIRFRVTEAKKVVSQWKAWLKRRQRALKAFDDLGGKSVHTDAKLTWDDNQDWD